jgi:hypothetical protein
MNILPTCFQLITEILPNMRTVKMCGWEAAFSSRVNALRRREWDQLAAHKYIDAIFVYLWASAPVAIAVALFATYVLMRNTLTAAKVRF